jgi:2-amino-4-hydroxy-6-hydroxymethyldihydropteridine diphosphokinase
MKKKIDVQVIISIGSNIHAHSNIIIAMELIAGVVEVLDCSRFYITTPIGNTDQPDFINGACKIKTHISARELKYDFLREIEHILGRVRSEDKNAPRQIDLDIALYGDAVISEEGLVVPDPGLFKYPFVSIPVRELVGDIVIPGTKKRLKNVFGESPEYYGYIFDEKVSAGCKCATRVH